MNKFFRYISLLFLMVFSFYITDRTTTVIKNMDEIMIEIKKNKNSYKAGFINAVINKKEIIPGISARVVNVNKSYKNMKEYGKYNPKLHVYDYIKPKISVNDNKDKYISRGNSMKRMVSVNLVLKDDIDVSNILMLCDKNNIKVSFIIDSEYLGKNLDFVYALINKNYNIIFNIDNKKDLNWMNTIINKIGKQKNVYCFYKNNKTMNMCKSVGGYTIKGIDIDNNYYGNIIKNLYSGSIFNLKVNNELGQIFINIINYINMKGLAIESLDNHLKE